MNEFTALKEFLPPTRHTQAIKRVNYTHDALIDLIIAEPHRTQRDFAGHFGYTEGWLSQIIASDAFQAKLAERKDELVDPTIRATIEERFKALVVQSLEVLKRKLESPIVSDDLAIKALDVAAKAAGYGAKSAPVVQNQFVVHVPAKAASSEEWAQTYSSDRRGGSAVDKSDPQADRLLEELRAVP